MPLSREQFSRSVLWLHLLFVRGFWLGFRREIRDLAAPSRLHVVAPSRLAGTAPGGPGVTSFEVISSLNISWDPGATGHAARRTRRLNGDGPARGSRARFGRARTCNASTPNPANTEQARADRHYYDNYRHGGRSSLHTTA